MAAFYGSLLGLQSTVGFWAAFIVGVILAFIVLAIGTNIMAQHLKCEWKFSLVSGISLMLTIASWHGVKEALKPHYSYMTASYTSLLAGLVIGWISRIVLTNALKLKQQPQTKRAGKDSSSPTL